MTELKSIDRRTAPPRPALAAVETWIFDLDNTLYPSSAPIFPQIHKRMQDFLVAALGVDAEEARVQRSRFYREYGTTMRGMMVERGTDPRAFQDYVHAIDVSVIVPDPRLDAAIGRLPGRKLIFTNASDRHAANILGRLGLAHHFEAIFDVEDCGWLPKPDAAGYATLVARHNVDPSRAAMIDDIPRNLEPAAALGMTTIWVREPGDPRWTAEPPAHDHIDHVAGDLAAWLEALPLT